MFRIDRSYVNLIRMEGSKSDESEAQVKEKEPEPEVSPEEAIREMEAEAARRMAEEQEKARLEALRMEAQETVSRAENDAARIIADAQRQAAQIRETAQRAGFDEGKREAEASVQASLQAARQEDAAMVRRVIYEIEQARESAFEAQEEEIIELSLAIAKKIVNVALKKDDTIFESIIKKALRQMKWEGKITIRVSGEEYERFFSSGSATFVLGEGSVTASVIEDPSLNSGDCVIESDGEAINAGVDSQFKYVELAFNQADGMPS